MDKKISRRVALGMAIGGLTAGALFLRSSRRPELAGPNPYGKIDVPPDIDSDLSADDVQRAFEVLQEERDMWLRFRGVVGKIQTVKETVHPDTHAPETVVDEGYVSWSFDLEPSTNERRGMLVPTNSRLVYSDAENGTPAWTFAFARRDSRSRGEFTGKEIGGVRHGELYSLLALPTSLLTLVNGSVKEMAAAWKVGPNSKASTEPDSYVFESNGTPISEGVLLPAIRFVNGHFSGYIPKRMPNTPFPVVSLTDQVLDKGIAFPTVVSQSFADTGTPLPGNASITVTLSDIRVATA